MAMIGWGKPRIFYKEIGKDKESATWKEFHTPMEGSTTLSTTKGDKQEAKIEGGANEDVKYGKNTYALTFNIRAAKDRVRPIEDEDGVIKTNYAIAVQPEDPKVPGFAMEATTASVEDNFTSADGGVWAYTFDALQPTQTSMSNVKQVQWGVINVTEANGTISNITIDLDGEGTTSQAVEIAKKKTT
ncbi:MAG: VCBS domain-containing protein [Bacteroidaceae bacterium]|nr:VCBS domain-containing protein [Bacteroidaceae bacterium]